MLIVMCRFGDMVRVLDTEAMKYYTYTYDKLPSSLDFTYIPREIYTRDWIIIRETFIPSTKLITKDDLVYEFSLRVQGKIDDYVAELCCYGTPICSLGKQSTGFFIFPDIFGKGSLEIISGDNMVHHARSLSSLHGRHYKNIFNTKRREHFNAISKKG